MTFQRFVAIGDSFTEGVGDPDENLPNGVRGWADRVAEVMAGDDFAYANLAIRGRKMMGILQEQVQPALAMKPDVVSIYGGANDILRPKIDIDALVRAYDIAMGKIVDSGAHVLTFTAFDPGGLAVFGALRGRFAVYNELVREVAEKHNATLVDFWRLRDYRDDRLWDIDRMHMSSAGHQRMAIAVLDALGVSHDLVPVDLGERTELSKKQRRAANADWAKSYVAPWVQRRVTGKSSGDALSPRWPSLTSIAVG